jgi:hypothetical protein
MPRGGRCDRIIEDLVDVAREDNGIKRRSGLTVPSPTLSSEPATATPQGRTAHSLGPDPCVVT